MALTLTLGSLVGLCQRRSNKEADEDEQLDTDEWKELIAEHYGVLHAVATETGARYFETEATITATGATSYALPADHLSTVGVDYEDTAGNRRELPQLMVQERALFNANAGPAQLWCFSGTSITLYPRPSTGTYKHIYVPQPADLTAGSNGLPVDVMSIYGRMFIVWGVASVALHKGDTNQLRAVEERDRALQSFKGWAVDRAMTMPKRRIVAETDLGIRDGSPLSPGSWLYR